MVRTPEAAGSPSAFQSTQWSVVLRAGDHTDQASREALETLCQTYWYPLYAFVRRRGNNHHDAMDLTQGFFVHLMERNRLAQVHPDNGRFRAFLLASIRNFITAQWRKGVSTRRGGNVLTFTVDSAEFEKKYRLQSTSGAPDSMFEREWVESLILRVLDRLRQDYQRAGKAELFDALSCWLVGEADRIPQPNLAAELGISVSAVGVSVFRMRQRFAQILRQEVAHTLADPADVDDELARLKFAIR